MTEKHRFLNDPQSLHIRRRRWLTAALGGAAALAGAGLAWRTYQPQSTAPGAEAALWGQAFARPDGTMLNMASMRGRPVLLNFWATWCPPCVEELPLLSDFYRLNSPKGWQVLGFAVDQVEPVKRFLLKTPVTFPVLMAGTAGIELSKSLGNLVGGLPFTVVFGSDGLVAHRKMGKVTPADLLAWGALT